jgi:hypothetical protein
LFGKSVLLGVVDVQEHDQAEDHQACQDEDDNVHRSATSVYWCEKPCDGDKPESQKEVSDTSNMWCQIRRSGVPTSAWLTRNAALATTPTRTLVPVVPRIREEGGQDSQSISDSEVGRSLDKCRISS